MFLPSGILAYFDLVNHVSWATCFILFLEDTLRQLLARSRYLLFKAPGKWTDSQKRRAGILFKQFPDIKAVCYYALRWGKIFTDYIDKDVACAKNLEVGVKNRTFIMEVCCI